MVSFVVIAEMPLLTLAIDAIHFKAGTGNSMPHDSHNGCAMCDLVICTVYQSTVYRGSELIGVEEFEFSVDNVF